MVKAIDSKNRIEAVAGIVSSSGIGCLPLDTLMNSMGVVPVSKPVQLDLNEIEFENPKATRQSLPQLHGLEESFYFAVELRPPRQTQREREYAKLRPAERLDRRYADYVAVYRRFGGWRHGDAKKTGHPSLCTAL